MKEIIIARIALLAIMVLVISVSLHCFDTRTPEQKRQDLYYDCVQTKIDWSQPISDCDNIK